MLEDARDELCLVFAVVLSNCGYITFALHCTRVVGWQEVTMM